MNESAIIIHEITTNLAPVLFFVVFIVCLAWCVNTLIRSLKAKANVRTRSELYRQMIDRFGTAPEFIAFLQSDTGQKFIDGNVNEEGSPKGKILVSVQIGIVTTIVGIGMFLIGGLAVSNFGGDIQLISNIAAIILIALGIGFLLSSFVTYRLCRAWGLMEVKQNRVVTEPK